MSLRNGLWNATAKYAIDPDLHQLRVAASPLEVYSHATEKYRERLPDHAICPGVAWDRGEVVAHPGVLSTHDVNPDSARVYAHNGEYWAVFIVRDGVVKTVYSSETHEHPPTQAYIREHGPHYLEVDDQ